MEKRNNSFCASRENQKLETSKDIVQELDRLNLLQDTMDELVEQKNSLVEKNRTDQLTLNDKILEIVNKPSFKTDLSAQNLVKEIQNKIKIKNELLKKRISMIDNLLSQFKGSYYKVCNKEVYVNCASLLTELENLSGKRLYCNASLDIISFSSPNLDKIVKKNKDKQCNLELTISDKKYPEYYKKLNNIFYSKSIKVGFDDIQEDGLPLKEHITLSHGITEDGQRYTSLKINDIDDLILKLKLGDLVNESEDYKPVDLLTQAVCNCKDTKNNARKIMELKK